MKMIVSAAVVLSTVSLIANPNPPPPPPAPAPATAPAPAVPPPPARPAPGPAHGGGIPAAFAQHANFAAMRADAVNAAMAAARAPDEKSRVIEWKRVDAVERKFGNMLNAEFNGAKISKEDRLTIQHMFYAEFVSGVREAEATVQDPETKAFFGKKLAGYERKLNQGQKKPEAKKKAPPKKKHDAKKKPDPKKDGKDAKKDAKHDPKQDAKTHDKKHKKAKK